MADPPAGERDPQEWLSVEQVSNELSVHQVTVREWLNRGLLIGSKAGRRKWRIRRRDLEEFLARPDDSGGTRETSPAPPTGPYVPPTGYAASVIDTLTPRETAS